MRLLFLAVFLIVNLLGAKDCKAQGPGTFQWTNGAPNNNPGLSGAKFAVDKNTYRWYEWVSGTSWVQCGDRIQQISGCAAPAYTPTIHNAYFVVNGCTNPEFYYWNGTAWKLLNGGSTYTAGTGIAISGGNVISADTSLLATQYDISQLGVTFPLLAPDSTTPQFGFAENPNNGISSQGQILEITGEGILIKTKNADFPLPLNLSGGDGVVGSDMTIRSGNSNADGEFGGSFTLKAGDNIAENGFGGTINLQGGNATNAGGFGGEFRLSGGIGALGETNKAPIRVLNSAFGFGSFTTTQRNAIPVLSAGFVIWNSTLLKLQVYNGTTWENLH